MGVWKEFKTTLDCLREEVGAEREEKGKMREVSAPSLPTAGECWVPAGRQQSANHVTSLTELSEHKTHFYVLKTMHIYIYTQMFGEST